MHWNWMFSSRQRKKMAVAMGLILIVVMLANWFVSYTIQQVNNQFKSVYQDRLVPASQMANILERYYQNQLLLEQHLQNNQNEDKDSLVKLWQANTAVIEGLIQQFETTYLTDQEAVHLRNFKQAVANLQQTQVQILFYSRAGDKNAAVQLNKAQYTGQFQQLLAPLHLLISLQEEVGHELYLSADRKVKSLKIISYMVIAMAVLIALIVGTLLQRGGGMDIVKHQKFQLN